MPEYCYVTGKMKFSNRTEARKCAMRMAEGHLPKKRKCRKRPKLKLEAYHCRSCGKWHVGNRQEKRERNE